MFSENNIQFFDINEILLKNISIYFNTKNLNRAKFIGLLKTKIKSRIIHLNGFEFQDLNSLFQTVRIYSENNDLEVEYVPGPLNFILKRAEDNKHKQQVNYPNKNQCNLNITTNPLVENWDPISSFISGNNPGVSHDDISIIDILSNDFPKNMSNVSDQGKKSESEHRDFHQKSKSIDFYDFRENHFLKSCQENLKTNMDPQCVLIENPSIQLLQFLSPYFNYCHFIFISDIPQFPSIKKILHVDAIEDFTVPNVVSDINEAFSIFPTNLSILQSEINNLMFDGSFKLSPITQPVKNSFEIRIEIENKMGKPTHTLQDRIKMFCLLSLCYADSPFEIREEINRFIREILTLSQTDIEKFLIEQNSHLLKITDAGSLDSFIQQHGLVSTKQTILLLQDILSGCIFHLQRFNNERHCIPILLQGPTGTGKTTIVQKIFKNLQIINCSFDTDINDILGSYGWMEMPHQEQSSNSPQFGYIPGPFLQSNISKRPFLFDEMNLLDRDVLDHIFSIFQRGRIHFSHNYHFTKGNHEFETNCGEIHNSNIKKSTNSYCRLGQKETLNEEFDSGKNSKPEEDLNAKDQYFSQKDPNSDEKVILKQASNMKTSSEPMIQTKSMGGFNKMHSLNRKDVHNLPEDHNLKQYVDVSDLKKRRNLLETLEPENSSEPPFEVQNNHDIDISQPIFININLEGKKDLLYTFIRISANEISRDLSSIKKFLQYNLKKDISGTPFASLDEIALFYHNNRERISFRTFIRILKKISHFSIFTLTGIIIDNYRIEYDMSNQDWIRKLYQNTKMVNNSNQRPVKSTYNEHETRQIIVTAKTASLLYQLMECVDSNFPLLLFGETSTGKTSIIKYFAHLRKKQLIRINNHRDIDKQDYLGKQIIVSMDTTRGGKRKKIMTQWIDGPLITAIKQDCWLLIDEINLCTSNVLEILNRLLDDNREIFYNNQVIRPGKNFRIFGTMNKGYVGRNKLSDAFMDRWVIKEVTIDLEHIVSHMLTNYTIQSEHDGSNHIAPFLLSVYNSLSLVRNFKCLFTLRDFFKIISRYRNNVGEQTNNESIKIGSTEKLSAVLYGMGETGNIYTKTGLVKTILSDYLTNRQRDINYKILIQNTIDEKYKTQIEESAGHRGIEHPMQNEGKNTNSHVDSKFVQSENQKPWKAEIHNSISGIKEDPHSFIQKGDYFTRIRSYIQDIADKNNFLLTDSHLNAMILVLKALFNNENVLLVGETGIGKTKMAQIVSEVINRELVTVCCNGSMDTCDLIGHYIMTDGKGNNLDTKMDNHLISFKPSTFVSSLENNSLILLDEINLPDHSVIERLNSLFDSHELFLTETGRNIRSNALIIATMNPGTYAGKKELSEALRNRFTEIFVEFKEYEQIYEQLITKRLLYTSGHSHKTTNQQLIEMKLPDGNIFSKLEHDKLQNINNINEKNGLGTRIFSKSDRDKQTINNINDKNGIGTRNQDRSHGSSDIKSDCNKAFNGLSCKNVIKTQKMSENKEYNVITDTLSEIDIIQANNIIKKYVLSSPTLTIRRIECLASFLFNDHVSIVKRYKTDINMLVKDALEITGLMEQNKTELVQIREDGKIGYFPYYIEYETETNIKTCDSKTHGISTDSSKVSYGDTPRCNKTNQFEHSQPNTRNGANTSQIDQTMSINTPNDSTQNETVIEKYKNMTHPNTSIYNGNSNTLCYTPDKTLIYHDFIPLETAYKFSTYNFFLLLRALSISNNILIEGVPGIGKTSIVFELGKILKKKVERVNLSECTEFIDLIGGYVPVSYTGPSFDENKNTSHEQNHLRFDFIESPFITALKENAIIILDEINLCTQSVLEGLNPLFDYRKYIEVNNQMIRTNSIIIGTMNPANFRGRNILPKSFVDRFVKIIFHEYDQKEIEGILIGGSKTHAMACSDHEIRTAQDSNHGKNNKPNQKDTLDKKETTLGNNIKKESNNFNPMNHIYRKNIHPEGTTYQMETTPDRDDIKKESNNSNPMNHIYRKDIYLEGTTYKNETTLDRDNIKKAYNKESIDTRMDHLRYILNNHDKISLRQCIRAKILGKNSISQKNVKFKYNGQNLTIGHTTIKKMEQMKECELKCDENKITERHVVWHKDVQCSTHDKINQKNNFDPNFVFLSQNIVHYETILNCLYFNIPLIVKGAGSKRIIEKMAQFLGYSVNHVYFHKGMDTGDLLGQYVRTRHTDSLHEQYVRTRHRENRQKSALIHLFTPENSGSREELEQYTDASIKCRDFFLNTGTKNCDKKDEAKQHSIGFTGYNKMNHEDHSYNNDIEKKYGPCSETSAKNKPSHRDGFSHKHAILRDNPHPNHKQIVYDHEFEKDVKFVWKDSPFIQSLNSFDLTIIHNANLLSKNTLDRLNSLSDSKELNIIEKGTNTHYKFMKSRIVFISDEISFSQPFIDRCQVIRLREWTGVDLAKILYIFYRKGIKKIKAGENTGSNLDFPQTNYKYDETFETGLVETCQMNENTVDRIPDEKRDTLCMCSKSIYLSSKHKYSEHNMTCHGLYALADDPNRLISFSSDNFSILRQSVEKIARLAKKLLFLSKIRISQSRLANLWLKMKMNSSERVFQDIAGWDVEKENPQLVTLTDQKKEAGNMGSFDGLNNHVREGFINRLIDSHDAFPHLLKNVLSDHELENITDYPIFEYTKKERATIDVYHQITPRNHSISTAVTYLNSTNIFDQVQCLVFFGATSLIELKRKIISDKIFRLKIFDGFIEQKAMECSKMKYSVKNEIHQTNKFREPHESTLSDEYFFDELKSILFDSKQARFPKLPYSYFLRIPEFLYKEPFIITDIRNNLIRMYKYSEYDENKIKIFLEEVERTGTLFHKNKIYIQETTDFIEKNEKLYQLIRSKLLEGDDTSKYQHTTEREVKQTEISYSEYHTTKEIKREPIKIDDYDLLQEIVNSQNVNYLSVIFMVKYCLENKRHLRKLQKHKSFLFKRYNEYFIIKNKETENKYSNKNLNVEHASINIDKMSKRIRKSHEKIDQYFKHLHLLKKYLNKSQKQFSSSFSALFHQVYFTGEQKRNNIELERLQANKENEEHIQGNSKRPIIYNNAQGVDRSNSKNRDRLHNLDCQNLSNQNSLNNRNSNNDLDFQNSLNVNMNRHYQNTIGLSNNEKTCSMSHIRIDSSQLNTFVEEQVSKGYHIREQYINNFLSSYTFNRYKKEMTDCDAKKEKVLNHQILLHLLLNSWSLPKIESFALIYDYLHFLNVIHFIKEMAMSEYYRQNILITESSPLKNHKLLKNIFQSEQLPHESPSINDTRLLYNFSLQFFHSYKQNSLKIENKSVNALDCIENVDEIDKKCYKECQISEEIYKLLTGYHQTTTNINQNDTVAEQTKCFCIKLLYLDKISFENCNIPDIHTVSLKRLFYNRRCDELYSPNELALGKMIFKYFSRYYKEYSEYNSINLQNRNSTNKFSHKTEIHNLSRNDQNSTDNLQNTRKQFKEQSKQNHKQPEEFIEQPEQITQYMNCFRFKKNSNDDISGSQMKDLFLLVFIALKVPAMALLGNIFGRMVEKTERNVDQGLQGGKGDCSGSNEEQIDEENDSKAHQDDREHIEGLDDGINTDIKAEEGTNAGQVYDKQERSDETSMETNEPSSEQIAEKEQPNQNFDQTQNDTTENDTERKKDIEEIEWNVSEGESASDSYSNENEVGTHNENKENGNTSDLDESFESNTDFCTEQELSSTEASQEEELSNSDDLKDAQSNDHTEKQSDSEEHSNNEFSDERNSDIKQYQEFEELKAISEMKSENINEALGNKEYSDKIDDHRKNTDQCCTDAINYETAGEENEEGLAKGLTIADSQEIEETDQFHTDDVVDENIPPLKEENDCEKNFNEEIRKIMNEKHEDHSLLIRLESILMNKRKYQGDYKSGKKLNLKKIIEFIASDYTRDKIWLKQKRNDKLTIRFFIDNTESMKNYDILKMLRVYARLTSCLTVLGVEVETYKFGKEYKMIKKGNEMFLNDDKASCSYDLQNEDTRLVKYQNEFKTTDRYEMTKRVNKNENSQAYTTMVGEKTIKQAETPESHDSIENAQQSKIHKLGISVFGSNSSDKKKHTGLFTDFETKSREELEDKTVITRAYELNQLCDLLHFDGKITNYSFLDHFTNGMNLVLTDGIVNTQAIRNDNFLFLIFNKEILNVTTVEYSDNQIVQRPYLKGFENKYEIISDIEESLLIALEELVSNMRQ